MNTEQFAEMIDSREYLSEMSNTERKIAKENGLVVVFGQSDDLMEFRGAIDGELDCYNGGTAYLDETGLWENQCEDEDCPYAAREKTKCKTIRAVWHDGGGPCWTYETDIPHATFDVYEDGEAWCVGIVFSMEDLMN